MVTLDNKLRLWFQHKHPIAVVFVLLACLHYSVVATNRFRGGGCRAEGCRAYRDGGGGCRHGSTRTGTTGRTHKLRGGGMGGRNRHATGGEPLQALLRTARII